MTDLLSQKNMIEGIVISKCSKSLLSQITSLDIEESARYSASAEDLDTMGCFFYSHDIRVSPRNTQEPDVDLHVSNHPPQLASA